MNRKQIAISLIEQGLPVAEIAEKACLSMSSVWKYRNEMNKAKGIRTRKPAGFLRTIELWELKP